MVLTDEALRFITALTFSALTRREVFTRENDGMRDGQPAHISLADRADLVVVAPPRRISSRSSRTVSRPICSLRFSSQLPPR